MKSPSYEALLYEFHVKASYGIHTKTNSREFRVKTSNEIHTKTISRQLCVKTSKEVHLKAPSSEYRMKISHEIHTNRSFACISCEDFVRNSHDVIFA